jgi:cbb3-type cytochrome oxidase maturation protein
MHILFVLIPLSLVLVAGAVWAFFWAVDQGQFDDLESPGWDVLQDDERS